MITFTKNTCICLLTYCMHKNHLPYELEHDKTNKMTCALSVGSDQPGHPISELPRCKIHWHEVCGR